MTKTLFKSFIFLLLTSFSLKAQVKIQGQIVDSVSKAAIPFATIGVKNRIIGTVADSTGRFQLSISPDSIGPGNPVIVSCVGYKSAEIGVQRLKDGHQLIALAIANTYLGQVAVKPLKFKVKTFGRTGSSAFMSTKMISEHNHTSDELGKEIGTVIGIDKNCRLTAFNMHVIFNHFDNVKFRLNIYSVKNGLADTLLIKDNILLDVGHVRQKWIHVDLTKYQIYLEGYKEVAVAIQWLKSTAGNNPQKSFNIAAVPALGHHILFRDKSQSTWLKVGGNLSMNFTADVYKD
ncbi:carboxypeptidase-like regulatory domain-containing protein [Mucilaginibacter calamicampi]|uniref:Carboxypeptidase-like regulatory domain-containing protein n=1 Tax=Mucilaginibacter calamicampi TaxID=1302352 RepID=A0ABW2Z495_9SPHI